MSGARSIRTVQQSAGTSTNPFWLVLTSPILWGTLVAVGFYLAIPYLPVEREFFARYFAGHWIEYATTGLFFVGMAILCQKAFRLLTERAVFGQLVLPDPAVASRQSISEVTTAFEAELQRLTPARKQTQLACRLQQVCDYLRGRAESGSLEDHLKYLAELAAEKLSGSYALVRTVTWAIPILGFLGTVIGITMAIANITPEQLESSLGEVTAGLAVAFDTTALSLALSMVLVFATYVVERWEGQLVSDVEDFGISWLVPCFKDVQQSGPLAEAEAEAARQLLAGTQELISRQTDLWQSSLEDLRQRWVGLADRQQDGLVLALQQGLSETLTHHSRLLDESRSELLQAVKTHSQELVAVVRELQTEQQHVKERFGHQLENLWGRIEEQADVWQQASREQSEQQIGGMLQAVSSWHDKLGQATEVVQQQISQLSRQEELLQSIVQGEGELLQLEGALRQNLQTVRSLDTLDETLHSLSAAVHLLSARSRHAA